MKRFTLILILFLVAGCGGQKVLPIGTIPLENHLVPTREDFKKAYGDTLETRLIFNIALLKNNDLVIANTINKLHPQPTTQPTK